MPAHTAKWQIGNSRKGDGTKLSHDDRNGNALADELAKKGAKLHRVPLHLRRKVEIAELVALRAALQLGVTTHAANNVQEEITWQDGTVHKKTVRDCNGIPKALRKVKAPDTHLTVTVAPAAATRAKSIRTTTRPAKTATTATSKRKKARKRKKTC